MTVEETFRDTQGRVRRRDRTPDGDSTRIHGYFYDNVGNRVYDDKGSQSTTPATSSSSGRASANRAIPRTRPR